MPKCSICGGEMKTAHQDLLRVVDGRPVNVLDVKANVCMTCGDVVPKWWTSYEKIDRLLSARLKRAPFESVTWEELISDETSTPLFP